MKQPLTESEVELISAKTGKQSAAANRLTTQTRLAPRCPRCRSEQVGWTARRKAPPGRAVTSFPIPTEGTTDEGAVVPFLVDEAVGTSVEKEGSSSGQPAGQSSLERRVRRMRSEPFAAGTWQSGAGVRPQPAPPAWKTVAPGERDILLCRTFPT